MTNEQSGKGRETLFHDALMGFLNARRHLECEGFSEVSHSERYQEGGYDFFNCGPKSREAKVNGLGGQGYFIFPDGSRITHKDFVESTDRDAILQSVLDTKAIYLKEPLPESPPDWPAIGREFQDIWDDAITSTYNKEEYEVLVKVVHTGLKQLPDERVATTLIGKFLEHYRLPKHNLYTTAYQIKMDKEVIDTGDFIKFKNNATKLERAIRLGAPIGQFQLAEN